MGGHVDRASEQWWANQDRTDALATRARSPAFRSKQLRLTRQSVGATKLAIPLAACPSPHAGRRLGAVPRGWALRWRPPDARPRG